MKNKFLQILLRLWWHGFSRLLRSLEMTTFAQGIKGKRSGGKDCQFARQLRRCVFRLPYVVALVSFRAKRGISFDN